MLPHHAELLLTQNNTSHGRASNQVLTVLHLHKFTCIHTHIHSRTHIHTYTHTCTHTHTHTQEMHTQIIINKPWMCDFNGINTCHWYKQYQAKHFSVSLQLKEKSLNSTLTPPTSPALTVASFCSPLKKAFKRLRRLPNAEKCCSVQSNPNKKWRKTLFKPGDLRRAVFWTLCFNIWHAMLMITWMETTTTTTNKQTNKQLYK